jgi:hypothetical protein
VPATPPVQAIGLIALPEQIDCKEGVATAFGLGLTTTVAVIEAPPQVLGLGVMVKVTVTGAVVVFDRAPLMVPETAGCNARRGGGIVPCPVISSADCSAAKLNGRNGSGRTNGL